MTKYFFIFLTMISLSASQIEKEPLTHAFFIVWNVGQGQWATYVDKKTCHHFDMGGEKNPLFQVRKLCADKENLLYLSHWDWDHISFALKARKLLKKACVKVSPLGKSKGYKMKILEAYKACGSPANETLDLRELTAFTSADLHKKTNELSHVLLAREKYLIPGDSTSTQEKIWSQQKGLVNTRLLVLGHHGSKTSTSDALLEKLPHLKIAVASARQARYGHPHFEVTERLKKFKVLLLRTEDWGNLWFQDSP